MVVALGPDAWACASWPRAIETDQEELMLRRLGCDLVQGFGVGRPMGAADCARWLARSA